MSLVKSTMKGMKNTSRQFTKSYLHTFMRLLRILIISTSNPIAHCTMRGLRASL